MTGFDVPSVASRDEWRAARLRLLEAEKAVTRQRDEVSEQRRQLPMVEIAQDYRFASEDGEKTLADLFEGRDQLVIYHFMFEPDWDEGCPSCSYTTDNIGHLSHLHARRTTFALVSRAPLEKLLTYRERMGWTEIPWYSSHGSRFNHDFGVTIDPAAGSSEYNFKDRTGDPAWADWSGEMPGISSFLRHEGKVFHTWSGYERGIDQLVGTNTLLDLTAFGRQEGWERPEGRSDSPQIMGWLHRHDEYPAG